MENKVVIKGKFWGYQQNRDVYNLFKEGKKIEDIALTLGIRPDTVINTVTNDQFVARLDKYLKAKVYMHQTTSILALDDIAKRLWDRVKNTIQDVPAEICLKELTRLISQRQQGSPKVINPKQYNVTFNDQPEEAKKMLGKIIDDDFGYTPLPDAADSEYLPIDVEPTP